MPGGPLGDCHEPATAKSPKRVLARFSLVEAHVNEPGLCARPATMRQVSYIGSYSEVDKYQSRPDSRRTALNSS